MEKWGALAVDCGRSWLPQVMLGFAIGMTCHFGRTVSLYVCEAWYILVLQHFAGILYIVFLFFYSFLISFPRM